MLIPRIWKPLTLCISLILLLTACGSSKNALSGSEASDFANVSNFSKNELVSYLKEQSVESYQILQTTISARTGEDHRYTAVYLVETTDKSGNTSDFSYGFYLLRHSGENFEILEQGTDVDSNYLDPQSGSGSAG